MRCIAGMRGCTHCADCIDCIDCKGYPILGESQAMQEVKSLIKLVAASDASVLLIGPSGSGKELVAQAIHRESVRRHQPFIPVNCGAIPGELLESHLFGHEKGAFTGAVQAQTGRFELANKGTLLLDEIAEMPLGMQVKLLRVLQDWMIERVGARSSTKVDVRVIAATHQDLASKVSEGAFREDLFYRLNVFPIYIPPLRDRDEDILLLWDHFAQLVKKGHNRPIRLTPRAVDVVMSRPWDGNCRELSNMVERLTILYPGSDIGPEHLLSKVGLQAMEYGQVHITHSEFARQAELFQFEKHQQTQDLDLQLATTDISAGIDITKGINLKNYISNVEKDLIQQAVNFTDGNVSKASKLLNIQRTTLIEKIKKYQLQRMA